MKKVKKFIKNKELIKKIAFTVLMLFIYRLGCNLIVGSVDTTGIENITAFEFFDMMTGASLSDFTLFSLGLSPVITASIIIELLSNDIVPALARIKKENDSKKKNKIVNALGIILAAVQSLGITYMMDAGYGVLRANDIYSYIFTCGMLTAGGIILLWISTQIDVYGIGNGSSLIIASGILYKLPGTICDAFNTIVSYKDLTTVWSFVALMATYIAMIMFVVFIENSEKRLNIQFAQAQKNVFGGKKSDYLPIKVNPTGVIPVIFSASILQFPVIICSLLGKNPEWLEWVSLRDYKGIILYAVLTVYFTFFYTKTIIDPSQINRNLKNTGGNITGVRIGKDTIEYINKTLNRICFYGAAALLIIALVPVLVPMFWTAANVSLTIGGTSLIIVTSVTLEIAGKLKTEMSAKKYTQSMFNGFRRGELSHVKRQ